MVASSRLQCLPSVKNEKKIRAASFGERGPPPKHGACIYGTLLNQEGNQDVDLTRHAANPSTSVSRLRPTWLSLHCLPPRLGDDPGKLVRPPRPSPCANHLTSSAIALSHADRRSLPPSSTARPLAQSAVHVRDPLINSPTHASSAHPTLPTRLAHFS